MSLIRHHNDLVEEALDVFRDPDSSFADRVEARKKLTQVLRKLDAYEAALRELHEAGLELAPHIGMINAKVSVLWDDAMGAAADVLE